MPYNVLQSFQYQLQKKGIEKNQAEKIAYQKCQKLGYLLPGSKKLSDKGKDMSKIGKYQREIARKSKQSKRSPISFVIRNGKAYRNPMVA